MDLVILTTVCVAALGVAAFFSLRWGGLRVEPRPLLSADGPPSKRDALLRYLRGIAIATVGGVVAGPLVLGLGGRLAMRITAATSDDLVQGTLTEAEETVGEITLGGTLGLVIFVGLFGGFIGGLLYMGIRRWLRGPAWRAGLVVGVLGLALVGRGAALEPDSIDFEILSPRWLAVLLFVVLAPLFGIVLAVLIERLDRSYPTLAARPGAIAAHAPLLLFLLAPPFVLLVALGALVAMFAPRVRPLARTWQAGAVERGGQVVLAAVIVLGLVWLGTGVGEILS
ncbi:MAG: hypothetical protein ACT4PI_17035 [Actinomycetota bacterium]